MGMDLRCLVFSSDEAAAQLICQALAELGAEADHCPDASAAIGRVASESFQIVIADWDEQPNAEYLLKAARARKPAERPLTLAVVTDDPSVPKALQAGANSVLRKPILLNQVKDTLETARSLLKAKQDSAASAPALTSQNSSPAPSTKLAPNESHLRAGEFLTSSRPAPSAEFDTDSQKEMVPSAGPIDALKDLEPMAAAVTPERPAAAPPRPPAAPQSNEPRGLQWYMNQRAVSLPSTPTVPMPPPLPAKTPELMGYDQMAAQPEASPTTLEPQHEEQPQPVAQKRAEAELFSHITQGTADSASDSVQPSAQGFRLGKRAIAVALALATCAIVAAPQAPWHPTAQKLWARGQRSLHTWLNPQVVEPAQAPETHENFGRPGDEYKLPVAETIPDATTDPSQIRVVPVVDPTAKKPGNNTADQNPDISAAPTDSAQPSDGQPATAVQASSSQPAPATSSAGSPQPANSTSTGSAATPAIKPPSSPAPTTSPAASQAVQASSNSSSSPQPAIPSAPRSPQKANPPVVIASANAIPSSLKSQMASTVPDQSGNKSPDTAPPAIEPVSVPEAAERALVMAQPAISYPADAKGQQGTVILQLLIGRDGSVQDAKFIQGSLAFARAAIDGVQSWKFKPYLLNGRPVSVQTQLTLSFSPGK
jgi:periplasmic protein TonB